MSNSDIIFNIDMLSHHLFWDMNRGELNIELHSKTVISQVLKYGLIDDWRLIRHYYGLNKIIDTARDMKDLDLKTASYLSIIGNIDKNEFICYSEKQSPAPHWNF